MKALNLILITSGKISEATAHIWVVSISGDNTSRVYCKSPYKAMRYAFLLKKRTGLNISDNSFAMLAALGKVQASLTSLSFAQHLPLPLLPPHPSARESLPPSALHAREPMLRLEAERKDRPPKK